MPKKRVETDKGRPLPSGASDFGTWHEDQRGSTDVGRQEHVDLEEDFDIDLLLGTSPQSAARLSQQVTPVSLDTLAADSAELDSSLTEADSVPGFPPPADDESGERETEPLPFAYRPPSGMRRPDKGDTATLVGPPIPPDSFRTPPPERFPPPHQSGLGIPADPPPAEAAPFVEPEPVDVDIHAPLPSPFAADPFSADPLDVDPFPAEPPSFARLKAAPAPPDPPTESTEDPAVDAMLAAYLSGGDTEAPATKKAKKPKTEEPLDPGLASLLAGFVDDK